MAEDDMVKVKVAVPPGSGWIIINVGGEEVIRAKEEDGFVEIPFKQLEVLLANVPGAVRPLEAEAETEAETAVSDTEAAKTGQRSATRGAKEK